MGQVADLPKALNITEKGLDQTIGVITTGVEDGQVATINLVTTGYSKTYTGTILNNSSNGKCS